MRVLTFINSYIKYLYLLFAISFIVLLIMIIKKINIITKNTTHLKSKIDNIENDCYSLSLKQNYINNAFATTIPFFAKLFITYKLIDKVLSKIFKSKEKKKDLKNHFEILSDFGKVYKAASDVTKMIKDKPTSK